MVQMECDYVTPSFFRELEKQYQLEQQAQGQEGEGGNDRLNQLATGGVGKEEVVSKGMPSWAMPSYAWKGVMMECTAKKGDASDQEAVL